MSEGVYRIAGHAIGIVSLYEEIHKLCAEYCTKEDAVFWIRISETDIQAEREKAVKTDEKEGRARINYPADYLETLAVYRKMVERLLDDHIMLMHGSVVAVDGKGYLFTAKSGTGKSTHTELWMQQFGDRALMINDDKPLIEVRENEVLVYGTPWAGKHHRSTNICVPLKAICGINRGEKNAITKVGRKQLYPLVLQQTHRMETREGMLKLLDLIEKLMDRVELYNLYCQPNSEAVMVAYMGMNKEEEE